MRTTATRHTSGIAGQHQPISPAETGEPGTGARPDDHEPQPLEQNGTARIAYSVAEAALLTGLSRDLLYDQMRRGRLGYVKIGRRLITRRHLQQFLGEQPQA